MTLYFRESLKEKRVRCEVILPKFSLKVPGGHIPAIGETVELDLDTAKYRERRGQVKIISEPFLADLGVRVENPPRPPWPRR